MPRGRHKKASIIRQKIGIVFYDARMNAGLTIRDAAKRIGCNKTAIWAMESGYTCPVWSLFQFAAFYRISLDEICNDKEIRDLLCLQELS